MKDPINSRETSQNGDLRETLWIDWLAEKDILVWIWKHIELKDPRRGKLLDFGPPTEKVLSPISIPWIERNIFPHRE